MTTLVITAPRPSTTSALAPLLRRRPLPLLPVLGKPLIAYQLDLATSFAVDRVVVLADDRPEAVRAFTGDGGRWGLAVEVVAIAPGLEPSQQLARAGLLACEPVVVAGEALVPPRGDGRRQPPPVDWADSTGWLVRMGRGRATAKVRGFRIDSIPAFHRAHLAIATSPGGLVVPGFEVRPGLTVARGSRVAREAMAEGPVVVGASAQVAASARLGPAVTIGPGAVVEAEARLVRTVVMPGTYVGRLIEGEDVILDGRTIIDGATGSVAVLGDDLLLAELEPDDREPPLRRLGERAVAAALLAPALPLALLAWWRAGRPALARREVLSHRVRHTVAGDAERLTTELCEPASPSRLLRWVTGLVDVVSGRLALVGNPPLTEVEAAALEPEVRERWLEAPVGLFGLAQAERLARPDATEPEDMAAAAALYAGQRGLALDLRLVVRCLHLLLRRRPVDDLWATQPVA